MSETNTVGRLFGRGVSFNARTSGVTVAVNRRVKRDEDGGKAERHVLISGSIEPGPGARSRSASSSTTALARFNPTTVSSPDVRI